MEKKEIESLNEKLFTDLEIDELERRLAMEDLSEGERCWTCSCEDYCPKEITTTVCGWDG